MHHRIYYLSLRCYVIYGICGLAFLSQLPLLKKAINCLFSCETKLNALYLSFLQCLYFVFRWHVHHPAVFTFRVKVLLDKCSIRIIYLTFSFIAHRFGHPVQVGWISIVDFHRNHFGHTVRMIFTHEFRELINVNGRRFDHQQQF